MIYKLKIFIRFIKFLLTHPKSFRYFGQWMRYKFFFRGKNFISAGLPWMNFEVCQWLRSYLTSEMKIFEWGSGGSTIFYANLVDRVISIEYDEEYFDVVKKQLKGKENVELILAPPQKTGAFKSFSPHHIGSYFDNYVKTIEKYPDRFFDVIVVDGRQRNECFKVALNKVKEDGIVVFDNFEREIYKKSQYYPGLSHLMIEGLMPFNYVTGTTAIFYYDNRGKEISR